MLEVHVFLLLLHVYVQGTIIRECDCILDCYGTWQARMCVCVCVYE